MGRDDLVTKPTHIEIVTATIMVGLVVIIALLGGSPLAIAAFLAATVVTLVVRRL